MGGIDQKKLQLFETTAVPVALTTMAIPTIVSQLITLIYNMADTWFIGRTDNPYMVAASSLVLTIFLMAAALATVFGTGGGSLVVRLMGAGDTSEARRVASWNLTMAAFSSLCFSLLCLLFIALTLFMHGSNEAVLRYFVIHHRRQLALAEIVI